MSFDRLSAEGADDDDNSILPQRRRASCGQAIVADGRGDGTGTGPVDPTMVTIRTVAIADTSTHTGVTQTLTIRLPRRRYRRRCYTMCSAPPENVTGRGSLVARINR